jgi:hypothetical protein
MHGPCSGRPSCMQYSALRYNSGMCLEIRSKVFSSSDCLTRTEELPFYSAAKELREMDRPVRLSFARSQRNVAKLYVLFSVCMSAGLY